MFAGSKSITDKRMDTMMEAMTRSTTMKKLTMKAYTRRKKAEVYKKSPKIPVNPSRCLYCQQERVND